MNKEELEFRLRNEIQIQKDNYNKLFDHNVRLIEENESLHSLLHELKLGFEKCKSEFEAIHPETDYRSGFKNLVAWQLCRDLIVKIGGLIK